MTGILFFFLYVLSSKGFASNTIPEDNLKYPVLVSFPNGEAASGFFIFKPGQGLYFVTAKHVFFTENMEALKNDRALLTAYTKAPGFDDQVKIELNLAELTRNQSIRYSGSQDVVAIKMAGLAEGSETSFLPGVTIRRGSAKGASVVAVNAAAAVKLYGDVSIADEIYIFGYPVSLGIENFPQVDYERPLLRKGVIAGKNEKLGTMILDCAMYYGNSGGPIVQVEAVGPGSYEYRVIGLVSEFIPFQEKWLNLQYKYANTNIQNTGYSVAVPIDAVLDILNSEKE
jgi:hypothetical protein